MELLNLLIKLVRADTLRIKAITELVKEIKK